MYSIEYVCMMICISADRQRVHELLASPAVRAATALKKQTITKKTITREEDLQRVERREVPPRQTVLTEPQRQAAAAAAAYAASPDRRAKAAGAVLCVEGARQAGCNGYYKQDGASPPRPL